MIKLLIVDDNEQNLYMLEVLLEGHGYEVVLAANGAEALDKARRDPPDVIVSDILMPVMDGFTLCRQWKKDDQLKEIPFVFYTATYTDPKDEELALSCGAERFVVKPVGPDVFVEMVREVVREAEEGRLVARREPPIIIEEEPTHLKQYSERLVKKLEDKMLQLEEANRALKRELAERKRAEEALQRSEDLLKETQRISMVGGWEYDVETGEAIWTEELYHIHEFPPDPEMDHLSRSLECYPSEARPVIERAFQKAVEDGEAYDLEAPFITAKGNRRWVRTIGRPHIINGKTVRITGNLIDITERKRAEEALRGSELQYRTTIDSMGDAIHVVDTDLRFVLINTAFKQWTKDLGLETDVIGRTVFEVFPFLPDRVRDEYHQAFDSGKTLITEESVKVGGKEFVTETRKIPVFEGERVARVVTIIRDITERKRAEETLRESRERLASIYETVGDVIFQLAVEPEGRYRFVSINPAFSRVTGLSQDQVVGRAVHEVIPEPSLTMVLGMYRQAIDENKIVRWEETSDYPTGRLTGDVSIAPVYDDADNCTHLVGSVHDITERKRAEEALRESEEQLRRIVEGTQALLVNVDIQGRFTYANEAAALALGCASPSELIGKLYLDFIHPEDRDRVRDFFLNQVNTGQESTFLELRGIRSENEVRWFSFAANLIIEDGQIVGQTGVALDITERKRAEEALGESEERFRSYVTHAPEAVFVADSEGRYVDVNPAASRLTGYSEEELTKMSIADLADPALLAEEMKLFEKTKKSGSMTAEIRMGRKDGTFIWSTLKTVPLSGNRIMAFCSDITERKRAEEQIQASLREKEVLLREIHHRVKNNLQVISSLLDMSSMRTDDRQTIAFFTDARAKVHTMALIHAQLYQSERFDQIDMGSHAWQLVNYLAQVYTTKSRLITLVIEPSDVYLSVTQAIPCALVLNEVISNAFKHAFEEGQKGTIEISIQRSADDMILLRVKDDGIGLPEGIDFDKADTLGLKLVRNLAQEQLKGIIQVKRDRGTEFIIEFPVMVAQQRI